MEEHGEPLCEHLAVSPGVAPVLPLDIPVPVPVDSTFNSLPAVQENLKQQLFMQSSVNENFNRNKKKETLLLQPVLSLADEPEDIILSELECDNQQVLLNNDEANVALQVNSVTEDMLAGLEVHPGDVAIEIEIEETALHCTKCSRTLKNHRRFKLHTRSCNPDAAQGVLEVENKYENELLSNDTEKTTKDFSKSISTKKASSLRCKPCKMKFTVKKDYLKHNRQMHATGKHTVRCKQCPVRCRSQDTLDEHVKTHKSKRTECACGETFTRPYHLTRHLRQTGCNGVKITSFPCDVCDAVFTRKDNLMAHLRWHIKRINTDVDCKKCDSQLKSFSALLRHHMRDHEGNKHICDTCGSTVNSRVAFMKHLYSHKERGFKCTHCDSSFKSPEVLKRHSLKHAAVKPLQCALCPRTFIQPHELEAHTFNHTGRSKYYCDSCDTYFSSKATQKAHEKRLHGDITLRCPDLNCKMANKTFVTEQSLRIHMKMHEDNLPFECSHCDKRFHVQAAMRSHELTHDFQKPRRCPHCRSGRAYIRGDLLIRHVRVKHPDQYDDCLHRVRIVLGKVDPSVLARPTKHELDAMLQMLDAQIDNKVERVAPQLAKRLSSRSKTCEAETKRELAEEMSAVMSEEELASNIERMLERLIDADTLALLGWPDVGVDAVLASVLEQCGVDTLSRDKFPRPACLRENTKQLFLRVIEDATLARMMNTRTVDEVIRHVVTASQ